MGMFFSFPFYLCEVFLLTSRQNTSLGYQFRAKGVNVQLVSLLRLTRTVCRLLDVFP